MKTNPRIKKQMQEVLGIFSMLSGVTMQDNGGEQGVMLIDSHSPLKQIEYRYECQNRLFTQMYCLRLLCRINGCEDSFKLQCRLKKQAYCFICQDAGTGGEQFADLLNQNPFLLRLIARIDFRELEIVCRNSECVVEVEPMFCSIVRMILPPVVYAVKPKLQECVDTLQILQLILACLYSDKRVDIDEQTT